MDKLLDALVVVVILALAFTGMGIGWRARRRRQTDIPRPATPPADLGTILRRDDLFYVATTRADAPLDRIAVNGLGFRARAQLTVADSGLRLDIAGEEPVFVPVADLRGIGRATWTIDRAVGNDGLVFVRFRLGAAEVDAYLRPEDPAALVEAIEPLLPADTREAA
ncbi:PH-like domain-containing protein [Pseudolysinimonas sp.]|uniref:PH-like domain-containing protein n=1 Tax=Pseudolysinimonas sp. TaxID=2680009 RepID=UPI003F7D690F